VKGTFFLLRKSLKFDHSMIKIVLPQVPDNT